MPHLTISGGERSAPTETPGRMGIGVPGWAHPMLAPMEWDALSRPGLPLHWAVLDVARGPGVRPDPYCLSSAGRLHEAGVGLLGCLEIRDGTRSLGELVSDAHRFLDWYHVDGFYLAHCPTGYAQLAEIRRTATTLRGLCAQQRRYRDRHSFEAMAPQKHRRPQDGRGRVPRLVFAHGTHPHPEYAELADQLVTFRGRWADYRWSQVAEWTADHPPERFCHLVHGVPRPHIDEALRIARWQGAGTVYFTDRSDRGGQNPWETPPGYWDEIVSLLGPAVSE